MNLEKLNTTIAALPKVQQDLINLCDTAITNAIKALQIVAPKATIDLALSRIMLKRMQDKTVPIRPIYPNTGHGHVYPRPDGVKARCGGPAMCAPCALDATKRSREIIKELGLERKEVE